jgi:hypothetical protein
MAGPNLITPRRTVSYETSLGDEFLDFSVDEGEAKIQLYGVPDDAWRELVPRIGVGLHPYPNLGRSDLPAFS